MIGFFKKRWLLVILLLILVGGSFWFLQSRGPSKKDEKSFTVVKKDLSQTLTLSGRVDAEEKATVRFQSGGMLSWVGVKVGDAVEKGDALASMDQRSVRKNIDYYLNTYMKTRWDFENTQRDYRSTAELGITQDIRDTARRVMEKSQFDLNNSVINVELQDIARQYATIYSPINGVVTAASPQTGGVNIALATDGYTIVNPRSVYLSLLPDQSDVVKISPGMRATVTLDSFPEVKFSGAIRSIGFEPKSGESSTVYETKLFLDVSNISEKFKLGMTGDATFTLSEKQQVIAIPQTYLTAENGKSYVMKKVGNTKEKVEVQTGLESDIDMEITSGLSEGDIIYGK